MNVEELLNKQKLDFKISGDDLVVSCLNPEHDDAHPSMRIDRIQGIFNCFSCGFKGNVFTYFDEKDFNPISIKREKLKKKLSKTRSESIGLKMPNNFTPYTGNWRGIKPETYRQFNAFTHVDYTDSVVFPIYNIQGKISNFCARDMIGNQKSKYLFYPKGKNVGLYPAVPEKINGSILLVEGIFDMLNLWDKGLKNSVCCFGHDFRHGGHQ